MNPDLDQVALTPHLVITNQAVDDAVKYSGFEGHNGILGLGPADLSQGSLHPAVDAIVPTVMDNAVSQGLIEHNIFGISFAPPTMENETSKLLFSYRADLFTRRLPKMESSLTVVLIRLQ